MLSNTATGRLASISHPPPPPPPHTQHTQPSLFPPSQLSARPPTLQPSYSSRTPTPTPRPRPPSGFSDRELEAAPIPARPATGPYKSIASPKSKNVLADWEDIFALRDEFLTQNARQRSGQELVRLLRRRAQDARADLMKILNATVARNDFVESHARLREAAQRVEIAEEALSLQEHDLTTAEGNLLVLGHRLQQRELSLKTSLRPHLFQQESQLIELPSSPTSSAYSSDSGFAMPDDPLLAQFYSCIGDLKILKDRLEQLQQSHESELEFRDRRRKADLPLLLSDSEFFNEYSTQHKIGRQRLHQAKKEARRLQSLCRQRAFNLADAGAVSEVSTSASSQISTDGEVEVGDESIQKRFPVFFQKSSESLLSHFKNRKDRVNRWLMDVLRISRLQVVRHRAFTSQTWSGSPSSDKTWSQQVWSTWSIESSAEECPASLPHEPSSSRGLGSTNESMALSLRNEPGLNREDRTSQT